jgi:LMBR1 domain-containing protein 1
VFLLVFVVTLFRAPRLDVGGLDEDAEDDEEEGLLASTGRRFEATWQDITGRSKRRVARYGATDGRDEEVRNGAGTAEE